MRTPLIRLARLAGLGLALACAGFVAWRWQASQAGLGEMPPPARIALASLLYAFCGLPLAAGWIAALRAGGERQVPAAAAACGYLQTQIGKYLPGGVFHFVARHVHGRGHGASHARLAAAGVLETLSLVLGAGLLTLLLGERVQAGPAWLAQLRWLPLAAALLALAIWLWSRRAAPAAAQPAAAWLLALPAVHLAFFLLSAAACAALLPVHGNVDFLSLLPATAAAWLAGYVVIGAPGGLGVREAVLVLLLKPALGEAAALGVAVGFRLATIAGDALMAASAAVLGAAARRPSST